MLAAINWIELVSYVEVKLKYKNVGQKLKFVIGVKEIYLSTVN